MEHRTHLLRGALRGNGVFSLSSASALLLFSPGAARVLGLRDTTLLVVIGVGLLAFGTSLLLRAERTSQQPCEALVIVLLDFAWVIASVVLAIAAPHVLSPSGRAIVLIVAAIVFCFALAQAVGVRRLIASDGTRGSFRSMLQVRRRVPVDPAQAWAVISDLRRYTDCARTLRFANVLSGHGVGMRRECGDHQGNTWSETCTIWDEGRRYAMEVHTAEKDYSLPFAKLRGEWFITREQSCTEVVMRLDFSMKFGLLGDVFAAAVAASAARQAMAVLECWEQRMVAET